jgi:magnesium transporter
LSTNDDIERLVWQPGETGATAKQNAEVIQKISQLIKEQQRAKLRTILDHWPESDLVELFVALPLKRARQLFEWRDSRDSEKLRVVGVLDPKLRSALLKQASVSRITEVLEGMEPEQAVRALDDLPEQLSAQVLPQLSARDTIEALRRHGGETAGSIMSHKFVAVPADWTIGMVTAEIRTHASTIGRLYGVSVVDEQRRPIGYLKLRDLLLLPKDARVRDVMHTDFIAVTPDTDREEVAHLADRYEMSVVPVVDAQGRLVGRITPTSLRQIIRDEAEEDIKIMAGLATDTQPDESVPRMVRGRAPWLLIGLAGASVSAVVVGSFEDQLAQAAILASFIPIVMSTAGNAGIQASTVAVQGLTAGTLTFADLGWRLAMELSAALLNGAIAATVLVLLVVTMAQFDELEAPVRLAVTAGLAELTVIVVAVAVGATVPVLLDRLGIDPAMATGVFITTGNDILAILIFFLMVTLFYFV